MEPNISLHSKLSSIMETMAESAMAELCKAVDEDTVELRLELSRLQTLNSALTEKVDTLECELTAARSDAPGPLRSHRTVAIQTDDDDDDVNESESPVINGVFGKDWCLNLWKDRFRTNQKMDAQQVDDDMNASMSLESFSPIDVPVLEKGAEFYSFESFSEAIESWQRSNFVELYKRSSRTVENAKKRARKKSYSENLVFAELDFACAHGSKGPDVKRCPFTIKVRVTPDGRKLYIKDISPGNCHNHELSQAVLTGSDPEHVDVIQVKVEDYLEGAGGSFPQETLSQENDDDHDDERFSEEVEETPVWLEDMSLDSDSKNHYDNNGTEEQSVPSSTGTEDDCYEYVIEDESPSALLVRRVQGAIRDQEPVQAPQVRPGPQQVPPVREDLGQPVGPADPHGGAHGGQTVRVPLLRAEVRAEGQHEESPDPIAHGLRRMRNDVRLQDATPTPFVET
ncbi:uncharacterized protein LOC133415128 isoform X4 [Phycodurus eques]|uniref:uncharacterized protein LOC133415128 isoform X4 n=1 Tax=Phycodurus eques TaxID=693459 RepID=UPI002ACED610|nr:uncharacterized protein LOC133415128 isoform X4 [Phycodurus eques]